MNQAKAASDPSTMGTLTREASSIGVSNLHNIDCYLLRRRWRHVMGRPAPPHLSQNLMMRIVMWREQILRHGDLDAATKATLDAVAESRDGAPGVASKGKGGPRLRPGTILVREHARILHRVTVLEKGFTWNGRTYGSLSEVARLITGTKWNGFRFFGVAKGSAVAKPRSSTTGDRL